MYEDGAKGATRSRPDRAGGAGASGRTGPAVPRACVSRFVRRTVAPALLVASAFMLSGCVVNPLSLRPVVTPVRVASLPTLSINNVSVTEGNSGAVAAVFTVTLSKSSSSTVTVHYASANGTALAPADFTAVSGTATFHAGQRTAPISVAVKGDSVRESDETFSVGLSSAAHATIARNRGTATIKNDDPTPAVAVGDVTVVEGAVGSTNAVFRVTLSNPSSATVTVDYTTQDNTASAPSDYTPSSGTLSFAPLSVLRTVTVPVNGDSAVEGDETFDLTVFNPVHATIADGSGSGTILNDDQPTISIADATVVEGNSGTTDATFTVTLSAPTPSTVTVDYQTLDGSATAPSDYDPKFDTLTFTPGTTSLPITIAVNGDGLAEPDETFFVHLTNSVAATILDGFGQGHIMNDDVVVPSVAIASPVAQNEGNSGTTNSVFIVTLSAPSSSTVTVDYTTIDGSATSASGDYTAQNGTLTFTAGQTSRQITVLISGDTTVETNETFTVNLSNPSNSTIAGTGIGTQTINNDDTLPTLAVAAPGATNEGNSGPTNFVFTVALSAPSSSTVTPQ